MDTTVRNFFARAEERMERYNLLKHPFYTAWTAGELTHEDLREYAAEYWHHVSAFPACLGALHARLADGPARRMVASNLADEEGVTAPDGRAHSDLWMDFAAGMGASVDAVKARELRPETEQLIGLLKRTAASGSPAAALAAFYAYESRVPAIAKEKAAGLKQHYGADAATTRYFTLHQTADVMHADVWRRLIAAELAKAPEAEQQAIDAMDKVAAALWTALDGVESSRQQRRAMAAGRA